MLKPISGSPLCLLIFTVQNVADLECVHWDTDVISPYQSVSHPTLQVWTDVVLACQRHSVLAASELCIAALQQAHPHSQTLWLKHLELQAAEGGERQRAAAAADMARHGLQPPLVAVSTPRDAKLM